MRSDDQGGQDGRLWHAADAAPLALDASPGADTSADAAAFDDAPPIEEPRFLFFRCAGADCAAPLAALREVLPQCPAALPLPHSPDWLLGIFALRAELVGLADPAPLLFGGPVEDRVPAPHGAALLVGTGSRAMAWAVESIGATAPFGPGMDGSVGVGDDAADGAPTSGAPMQERHLLEPAVAAPYALGAISFAGGQRYTVIDAEALLADMLHALEERPASA